MPVCTSWPRAGLGTMACSSSPASWGRSAPTITWPALQRPGQEPLYGDDNRRSARPGGAFGRSGSRALATAQPEFGACLWWRTSRARIIRRAAVPRRRGRRCAGEFGRVATASATLVARGAPPRGPAGVAAGRRTDTPRLRGRRKASPPMGEAIVPLPPSLRAAELERSLRGLPRRRARTRSPASPALDRPPARRTCCARFAFEEMPRKPASLPPDRRRTIVHALIAALYPDEPSRDRGRRQVFEVLDPLARPRSTRPRGSPPYNAHARRAGGDVAGAEWRVLRDLSIRRRPKIWACIR